MMSKKFCPKCKSENIRMTGWGGLGGWECVDCGFRGSVFPEKFKEEKEKRKKKK